jgi:hypothetical protein
LIDFAVKQENSCESLAEVSIRAGIVEIEWSDWFKRQCPGADPSSMDAGTYEHATAPKPPLIPPLDRIAILC